MSALEPEVARKVPFFFFSFFLETEDGIQCSCCGSLSRSLCPSLPLSSSLSGLTRVVQQPHDSRFSVWYTSLGLSAAKIPAVIQILLLLRPTYSSGLGWWRPKHKANPVRLAHIDQAHTTAVKPECSSWHRGRAARKCQNYTWGYGISCVWKLAFGRLFLCDNGVSWKYV